MRLLILSDSSRETTAYARSLGLGVRSVQHASTMSVRGSVYPVVIELPSFARRRDRHALVSALRAMKARGRGRVIHMLDEDFVYTRSAPQIEGELPGQTTIDDFLTEDLHERMRNPEPVREAALANIIETLDNGPIPPPAEIVDKPKSVAPTKPPTKPRQKRAAKKATPAPKPKTGSNALEPSPVDDFFGTS